MADNSNVLPLLYTNLGYKQSSTPEDIKTLISSKLEAADERLRQNGINPEANTASMRDLRVMYAAYLYNHRNSQNPMPQSLRLAINDAKVAAATIKEGTA